MFGHLKSVNFISFTVPKGENVINETFPFSWLGIVLLNKICLDLRNVFICKRHCRFCVHCDTMGLEIFFFSLNSNEFSVRITASISLRWCVGIRGSVLWNVSYALHTISIPSSCGILVFSKFSAPTIAFLAF